MGWHARRLQLPNGTSLPYLEQGDPGGVPVVLVHSYSNTGREFEPLLPYLPASLHAHALTFHGHGDADRGEAGFAVRDLSDEVAAFMDEAGLDSAVIVGSSSGGYIGQWFAGEHPGRTRGLMLLGTPARFRDKPGLAALKDTILALSDPIDPGFARQFGGDASFPHLPPGFLDEMVEESARLPAGIWKATYLGLWDAEPPSTTFRISVPTLIVWGDRDHFLPRSEQEDLRDAIPGSRLVVYEEVGHLVLMEEPERVARDLVAFVTNLGDRHAGA